MVKELIDNALDATEDLDDPLIKLETTLESDSIKIAIMDNGEGIRPEYFRKLFYPFFSTKKGRMGLGLPLSLKMIDQMGGQLRIENRDSTGVIASVFLKQCAS